MIADHLSISLNMRIHQFRTDTSLSAADQSWQYVAGQEGGSAGDAMTYETGETQLRMKLFGKVLFKGIVTYNVNNFFSKRG